ncbi:MAG: hypothetical protein Q8J78_01500 [Moraxellaceae bacterium]|nr:hypothetical protein [Moraxellaceae bacterium]
MMFRPLDSLRFLSLALALTAAAGAASAMTEIEESELGDFTGEGVALLPENFRVVFDPTAYIRQMPRGAPAAGSGVAGGFGNSVDLFWYGFAFSGANGDKNQRVSPTSISSWGTASNPWVFLATTPTFFKYNGLNEGHPILQYRAPAYRAAADFASASVMNLKYAFFGDIAICAAGTPTYGSTALCGGLAGGFGPSSALVNANARLQSISVWDGLSFHGSQYSIFQSTVDYGKYMGNAGVEYLPVASGGAVVDDVGTFGAVWLNRLNSAPTGVLRFGVGGSNGTANLPETADLTFNANEGVWVTDLDINMPVGHAHYQPLIFDSDAAGNLVIQLVRIPNQANVYGYAYCNYGANNGGACATHGVGLGSASKLCTNSTIDCTHATHGEVRMGRMEFRNSGGTTVVGSRGAVGTPGSVAIEGIFFQNLKITTLGL